jgi:hypothetical protein
MAWAKGFAELAAAPKSEVFALETAIPVQIRFANGPVSSGLERERECGLEKAG